MPNRNPEPGGVRQSNKPDTFSVTGDLILPGHHLERRTEAPAFDSFRGSLVALDARLTDSMPRRSACLTLYNYEFCILKPSPAKEALA